MYDWRWQSELDRMYEAQLESAREFLREEILRLKDVPENFLIVVSTPRERNEFYDLHARPERESWTRSQGRPLELVRRGEADLRDRTEQLQARRGRDRAGVQVPRS